MLLIDRVYSEHPRLPRPDAIIKVHDIADLILEGLRGGSKSFIGMKDVENLRLPFKTTWLEFFLRDEKGCSTAGILAIEKKEDKGEIINSTFCFMEGDGDKCIPIAGHSYRLFPNGQFISEIIDDIDKDENETELKRYFAIKAVATFCAEVMLSSLNFLHCKNVQLIENPLLAIDIKRRKIEGRDYFEKFYTLEILRVKRGYRSRPDAQRERIVRGQHICRGHFKHYDKKPLFGILYGTYFWPNHVRGSAKIGKISKDYKIRLN